jgi:hypothetical protein
MIKDFGFILKAHDSAEARSEILSFENKYLNHPESPNY